jgi:hypothetical protein
MGMTLVKSLHTAEVFTQNFEIFMKICFTQECVTSSLLSFLFLPQSDYLEVTVYNKVFTTTEENDPFSSFFSFAVRILIYCTY